MGNEIRRKLASIQRIEEVKSIKDADAIEAYRVLGWWVVGRKGEFGVGDLVIYLSIDSWVPNDLAPFLSKGHAPREFNGVCGERLKTIKLRGQLSQGLIMNSKLLGVNDFPEGHDLTAFLNIQKWEPPISASLQGIIKGNFPSFIPKTDQERIQNIFNKISKKNTFEVSMKLDGTSVTIFRLENDLRICSRNMEMQVTDKNAGNLYVAMGIKIGDRIPEGFAFQGELMGPGVQGNRENLSEHKFFVFDVYDITKQVYLSSNARKNLCAKVNLDHVPVLGDNWVITATIEEALGLAEGPSLTHKVREGVVWKCNEDPSFSFKVINNQFLLNEK